MNNGKQNKLVPMLKAPVTFAENVGALVCSCTELAVKYAAAFICGAGRYVKNTVAPLGSNIVHLIKTASSKASSSAAKCREDTAVKLSSFKRRTKIFGAWRAAVMQFRESRLAAKRKGGSAKAFLNIAFPAASIALLVFCVNTVMSTDYGVSVEYDGAEVGVVSGEEVLGEAQCVVADRVKYYDTDGDVYVTATLSIKPLASADTVIDQNTLAAKMEDRISMKYDEKQPEKSEHETEEAIPEAIEGKVKAYAVRVDGQVIGAVEDYSSIEEALNEIKQPYDSGEYSEINFDKDIEYDLEEYVDPEELVDPEDVIYTLTGNEAAPEYYEVQPGDNLWKIADAKGMTLAELSSCYATYNGQVIDDLENSILRVGTLIKIESEVPYLQVECNKEQTFRSTITHETITIEDPELPEGQTIVETEGRDGEKLSRKLVTYRDDTVIRKKTIDTIIVEQPVSEIIRIGTAKASDIPYDAPEFITASGSGEYVWPVDGGYISSHQGDGRNHKGIDIAAPYGTPIYAAASGTVTDAGTGWNGGYGNCIVIENDDGNVTVYAHQAELAAEVGDYIEAGQLIGYVGSTGDSTGNHLHFEIRKDGKYLDPENFVAQ